jgi:phospholipase C
MNFKRLASQTASGLRIGVTSAAILQLSCGFTLAQAAQSIESNSLTRSPIKHLIVIIGENRSFDHVFATYQSKNGEQVFNLLSQGIVNKDGTPGPNFYKAEQRAAADPTADKFLLAPAKSAFPNNALPAPLVGGPKDSYVTGDSLALAKTSENGLAEEYYPSLVSGGTGLTAHTPDTRIKNVDSLKPGPFQLTNGKTFTYTDYAASPVHRFYQMW